MTSSQNSRSARSQAPRGVPPQLADGSFGSSASLGDEFEHPRRGSTLCLAGGQGTHAPILTLRGEPTGSCKEQAIGEAGTFSFVPRDRSSVLAKVPAARPSNVQEPFNANAPFRGLNNHGTRRQCIHR